MKTVVKLKPGEKKLIDVIAPRGLNVSPPGQLRTPTEAPSLPRMGMGMGLTYFKVETGRRWGTPAK